MSGVSVGSTRIARLRCASFLEPLFQVPAREKLRLLALACERRRIDADPHLDGRLLHDDAREHVLHLEIADRVADRDRVHARDGHDLPRGRRVAGRAPEALERVEHLHVGLRRRAVADDAHLARLLDRAAHDAPHRELAHVVVVRRVADDHLQRLARLARRLRDLLEDEIEQGHQVRGRILELAPGLTELAHRVHVRKIRLRVGRAEIAEQIEHLAQHLVRARVRPIDLVDHDDHGEAALQALRQDEARLWKRAFCRVHEEQRAVGHHQRALDLAAEIGVAGRVDDVDLVPLVPNARVLREDRDASLALEIVIVHDAFGDDLIVAEGARLTEHVIDERRLPVVDVGDDGDVAQSRHKTAADYHAIGQRASAREKKGWVAPRVTARPEGPRAPGSGSR